MRFAGYFVLLLLLVTSCHSEKTLLGNVSSISVETSSKTALNIGTSFSYLAIAHLNSGDTKKIKNDAFISFPNNSTTDSGQHSVRIDKPLSDFTTSKIPIQIALEIGEYKVVSTDSIALNFKAPIAAIWEKSDGKDAVQPRASASTLFGRDGLEGKPGNTGQNGTNGEHFTGYLWQESDELRLILICDSSNQKYCYRSLRRIL